MRMVVQLLGLVAVWFVVWAGCQRTSVPAPTQSTLGPLEPTLGEPTATPRPTPTPKRPPVVVLLQPPQGDEPLWQELAAWFAETARAQALRWQFLPHLEPQIAPPDMIAVLAPPPYTYDDIRAWVQAYPETLFVVPGQWEAEGEPPDNLILLNASLASEEDRAFIAGALAAIIASPNFRATMMVSLKDEARAARLHNAFWQGGQYFCGLCKPKYGPFKVYPRSTYVGRPYNLTAWLSSARNMLVTDRPDATYLTRGAPPEVAEFLHSEGVSVIWDGVPANPEYVTVALRVDLDDFLKKTWRKVLQGELQGGQVLSAPLTFQVYAPEQASPGRMRLVQRIWDQYQQGLIDVWSSE